MRVSELVAAMTAWWANSGGAEAQGEVTEWKFIVGREETGAEEFSRDDVRTWPVVCMVIEWKHEGPALMPVMNMGGTDSFFRRMREAEPLKRLGLVLDEGGVMFLGPEDGVEVAMMLWVPEGTEVVNGMTQPPGGLVS